jgi:polar amino acid transport system permease protein
MFDNFPLFFSTIVDGLMLTVEATVGGILFATVLSFTAGLAMLSPYPIARFIARTYVEVWRGTSEVVQLLWIYFVLPVLTGFQLLPLWAGILVLGLNFGAYGAEIVRGAIQAVPKEQSEGCIALNLTTVQRVRRVILPQAWVDMIPPFNNLFIQLLKGTALLTIINVHEITYQARRVLLIRYTGQALLIWSLVLLFYLVLSIVITVGMRWLERRAAARVGRTPQERSSFLRGRNLSAGGSP